MLQPKLRRALAVLTLTLAATLATASGAGAAVLGRGAGTARVQAVQKVRSSWLRDAVVRLLEKAGVRIDPDGIW